jgi:hypothetical protein
MHAEDYGGRESTDWPHAKSTVQAASMLPVTGNLGDKWLAVKKEPLSMGHLPLGEDSVNGLIRQ